ncbi:MAG TPA: restriction endonuclease subunit S [Bacilli bacterium]|nr:restriction endonuclease subunit S [Bacilli bacterium]
MIRNMKDSCIDWIGRIPETWSVHRLGEFFTERREKVNDIDFPPLSVTKKGIVQQLETAAKSNDNENRKKVVSGDFVINSRSDRKQSCGLSLNTGSVSLINTVLTPRNIHPIYSSYLLNNYGFAEEYFRWGHGIVMDLWTTNWREMSNIPLPVPPTEEQHLIVSVLNTKTSQIDQLIALQEQQIEKLKEYKQSVISKAVTKGLDPNVPMKDSGIEWIGKIPINWKISRLRYLGQTRSGISNLKPDQFGFGYPFLSYKNVYNNWNVDTKYDDLVNSTEESRERFSIQRGDIFFTGSSETIEELGLSSVALQNWEKAVFNGFCIRLRPNNLDTCNPEYSKFYYRSQACRAYLSAYDNSITRTNLSQSTLKNMPVVIPPMHEQKFISAYLEIFCAKIDKLIDLKYLKIKKYGDYKKTLIYEYVTGKREVHD